MVKNITSSINQSLSVLRSTADDVRKYSQQISTGKIVNSAKDNGSSYAIANNARSEISIIELSQSALKYMQAYNDTSLAIQDEVTKTIDNIKILLRDAAFNKQNGKEISAIKANFDSERQHLLDLANNSKFDGHQLLAFKGNSINVKYKEPNVGPDYQIAVANSDATSYTSYNTDIFSVDLNNAQVPTINSLIGVLNFFRNASVDAQMMIGALDQKAETLNKFYDRSSNNLSNIISSLEDADLGKAKAKLDAAQVKQTLNVNIISNALKQYHQIATGTLSDAISNMRNIYA